MRDREKVIRLIEEEINVCESVDQCYRTIDLPVLRDILALLKEQERKKGSWDYGTQCSVCKGTIVPPWKRDTRVNFCPWCGADMRDSYEQGGRRS